MPATKHRSHTCGVLRDAHAGQTVPLAGWVPRERAHGQPLFIDLRDLYGLTQCVVDVTSPIFKTVEALRVETVVGVGGEVKRRSPDTVNTDLDTGTIELAIREVEVLGAAEVLPFPVNA